MDIVREFSEEQVGYWSDFDVQVASFTAPAERAVGIEPALGIITQPRDEQDLGVPCVRVAWKPSEIDLAHLARGGTIWLSTWGGLPPHMLEVQPPPDAVLTGGK
ncbi:MAG: hypothetical protein AB7H43_14055 [Acidimicrobiia bacterium]